MKELINKIKFEHILSIIIIFMMYNAMLIFKDDKEVAGIIINCLVMSVGGLIAFFFTKHNPNTKDNN